MYLNESREKSHSGEGWSELLLIRHNKDFGIKANALLLVAFTVQTEKTHTLRFEIYVLVLNHHFILITL